MSNRFIRTNMNYRVRGVLTHVGAKALNHYECRMNALGAKEGSLPIEEKEWVAGDTWEGYLWDMCRKFGDDQILGGVLPFQFGEIEVGIDG